MFLRIEARGHYLELGRTATASEPMITDHPPPLAECVGFLPPEADHIRTTEDDE